MDIRMRAQVSSAQIFFGFYTPVPESAVTAFCAVVEDGPPHAQNCAKVLKANHRHRSGKDEWWYAAKHPQNVDDLRVLLAAAIAAAEAA